MRSEPIAIRAFVVTAFMLRRGEVEAWGMGTRLERIYGTPAQKSYM